MLATGAFEVKLESKDFTVVGKDGINFARMSIDKKFTGQLDARSQGEMLSAMTSTQGSAGYVAIEQVFGKLDGKNGSFVLQHYGTMNKGSDKLILEVVPDSATGDLIGLSGSMAIKMEDGQHTYKFEYEI